jgi:hypothetical protein
METPMTNKTASQITALRAAFAGVTKMDPSGPAYRKLCSILDRADNDALKAVHAARIPFVSSLALNRMIRRGIA